jgi:hypothetical protein
VVGVVSARSFAMARRAAADVGSLRGTERGVVAVTGRSVGMKKTARNGGACSLGTVVAKDNSTSSNVPSTENLFPLMAQGQTGDDGIEIVKYFTAKPRSGGHFEGEDGLLQSARCYLTVFFFYLYPDGAAMKIASGTKGGSGPHERV